jgi:hypothetical protein
MSASKQEADVSVTSPTKVESKVQVRFAKLKGSIQVPLEIINIILFLHTALFAGMKETQENKIVVEFDTTAECARNYFAMKWHLLGKTEKDPSENWDPQLLDDIIELASFFQDEEFIELIMTSVEKNLESHFSKCTCGAMKFMHGKKYPFESGYFGPVKNTDCVILKRMSEDDCKDPMIAKYFWEDRECTIPVEIANKQFCKCEKKEFWVRLHEFISYDPLFAQWIWETIDRNTLLEHMEVPSKRVNTLFKMEFAELPEYIHRCAPYIKIGDGDPKLNRMYAELERIPYDDEGAYGILKAKIDAYERAKQRADKRRARNERAEQEDFQHRVKSLARMAQAGAYV